MMMMTMMMIEMTVIIKYINTGEDSEKATDHEDQRDQYDLNADDCGCYSMCSCCFRL